jgi:hypothetical protein
VITVTLIGGNTIRIVPTAIISLAHVRNGQRDGDRKIQTAVELVNGPGLWVCESVEEIEKLL